MNVYVAAPFEDAKLVRDLHHRLAVMGMSPMSRWAEHANGAEDFACFTAAKLRALALQNDADLRASDVALVIARPGAGGEMFGEARVAIEWGKAVVWVGPRVLSSWRQGVVVAEDIRGALDILAAMKVRHADGHRGHLLAHLAASAA